MRIRRHKRKARGDSTGIDLAPMLDFVMNLLIFFIITAVFAKEFGLAVRRPRSRLRRLARRQRERQPVHRG